MAHQGEAKLLHGGKTHARGDVLAHVHGRTSVIARNFPALVDSSLLIERPHFSLQQLDLLHVLLVLDALVYELIG